MPLPTPEEQAALLKRADAIIEDSHAFAAALAEKLAATREAIRGIAQPIGPPAKDP